MKAKINKQFCQKQEIVPIIQPTFTTTHKVPGSHGSYILRIENISKNWNCKDIRQWYVSGKEFK